MMAISLTQIEEAPWEIIVDYQGSSLAQVNSVKEMTKTVKLSILVMP